MRIKIPESERLVILRRLDELARENPELYQKVMFEVPKGTIEEKTRCRCEL